MRIELVGLHVSPELVTAMLEALTRANQLEMRDAAAAGVPLPWLYDAGVRYVRERRGAERWQPSSRLRRRRKGDCEDLTADVAAWLREYGGEPHARAFAVQVGPTTIHCLVEREDGSVMDPSRDLGM